MKKSFLVLLVFAFAACSGSGYISGPEADTKLHQSVMNTMKARGIEADVSVTRLLDLDDPKGFYYYKVNVSVPEQNVSEDQYFFYNGTYIANDFASAENGASMATALAFDLIKTDIDTSPFTVMEGTAGTKNVIVKITDFECPYCRAAYKDLQAKLAGNTDYAMYIVHMPLRNHPHAIPMARIFEAGMMMGKNYSHELFTNDELLKNTEEELVEIFAAQSGDPETFKANYNAPEVMAKLETSMKLAAELKVNATPIVFINGKRVEGFNPALFEKAIAEF